MKLKCKSVETKIEDKIKFILFVQYLNMFRATVMCSAVCWENQLTNGLKIPSYVATPLKPIVATKIRFPFKDV